MMIVRSRGTRVLAWALSMLWLMALIGAPPALAQATVGADIAGTVTDETGAVLPGVTVTVTSNTTGVTRTSIQTSEATDQLNGQTVD